MAVNKYSNLKYSGDVPLKTGDRRFAQDRIRDFWFIMDHAGLLGQDYNYPDTKFIAYGGVVSKGSGDTLDITAGAGYAPFSAYIPDTWAAFPPVKVAADVAMARIAWAQQTNMAIASAVLNGASVNYVKAKYAETDSNTRQRAKAPGTYSYEVTPGYTFTVDTVAPTAYEICLGTFKGSTGGSFTFYLTGRTRNYNTDGAGTELTADATLVNNMKYVINATTKLNLTLPSTANVGDRIIIQDKGYYGFKIVQNSGQWILVKGKRTVPGSGSFGGFSVKGGFATITIECVTADTTWEVSKIQDIPWMIKGYCMGGDTGSRTAVIEDMDFTFETSRVITATLDTAKNSGTGVSGFSKGYCVGGYTGSVSAVIEDMNFATESSAAITATLDTAKQQGIGVSGFSKGYCMGGTTGSAVAVIEDMNFATESSAAIVATLNTAKYSGAGVNSFGKGYCMGGFTGSRTDVIEDLNFSTESSDVITAVLDTAKNSQIGVSGFNKGYCIGGSTTAPISVIEDLNFATESSAAITATLDTSKYDGCGVSGFSKSYCMGGSLPAATAVIEDLLFAVESSSAISATLDTAKAQETGVQGYTGA